MTALRGGAAAILRGWLSPAMVVLAQTLMLTQVAMLCGCRDGETGSGAAASATIATTVHPISSIAVPQPLTSVATTAAVAPSASRPVTLAFVGDMAMSLLVGHWLDKRIKGEAVPAGVDAQYPFSHVRGELLAADLLVGNLECVVSDKGVKATDHNAFRAPLATPKLLLAAGFDVVSVANNHARDFGALGLSDMLTRLDEAGLAAIGAQTFGQRPAELLIREIRGVRVGLLGYYIITSTLERARRDLHAARDKVDVLVVFNHWGLEGHQEPANGQQKWAPALIEAGADLIVGTHAHVLQPERWFAGAAGRRKLVFYGLGNFVFTGQNYDELHATGGVLQVDIDKQGILARRFRRVRLNKLGAPQFLDEQPIEPCSVIPHCE